MREKKKMKNPPQVPRRGAAAAREFRVLDV